VPDYLKLAVASLDLGSDSEVLDAATGTGLLFRAVSLRVGRVVALDITPEVPAERESARRRPGFSRRGRVGRPLQRTRTSKRRYTPGRYLRAG
jgi:hypothetical protein